MVRSVPLNNAEMKSIYLSILAPPSKIPHTKCSDDL